MRTVHLADSSNVGLLSILVVGDVEYATIFAIAYADVSPIDLSAYADADDRIDLLVSHVDLSWDDNEIQHPEYYASASPDLCASTVST